MPIHWEQFDWQSFSTLATGILAVGAAIYVGRKQAKISEQQADILEYQADLAELALRHDLFDRRAQIYEAARAFLQHIVASATPPKPEMEQQFLTAMQTSKLLFPVRVYEELFQIWKRAGDFRVLHNQMQSTLRRDGHYGDGNTEKEHDQLLAFSKDLEYLLDKFGDDLKLTLRP